MGAYPACYRVRIGDNHDRDCFVSSIWRENGQLDAMGDGGGVVWNVFWGCCSCRVDGIVGGERVQETDNVRREQVTRIDG